MNKKQSVKELNDTIDQQNGIISSLIQELKDQNGDKDSKNSKVKYKQSQDASLSKFLKSKQFNPKEPEAEKEAYQINDIGGMKTPPKESASQILGAIYKLMKKDREELILDREEDKTKRKQDVMSSDKMHDELVEALLDLSEPKPSEFAKKVSAAKAPKVPRAKAAKGKVRKPTAKPKKTRKEEKPSTRPSGKPSEVSPAKGGIPKGEISSIPPVSVTPITGMNDVKSMVMSHEGVRTKPYRDSLGLWTIGVGHLIGDGKTLPPEWDRELTKEEVNQLFEQDFAKHVKVAEQTPGYQKANEAGKGAFIDLAFNMGKWWPKFPETSKALNDGDFRTAAMGLQNSLWYKQVGGRGREIVALVAQAGDGKSSSSASPAESMPKSAGVIPASDANKNLKDDMNAQKQSDVVVNNIVNNSVTNKSTSNSSSKKEDGSPYVRKSYA